LVSIIGWFSCRTPVGSAVLANSALMSSIICPGSFSSSHGAPLWGCVWSASSGQKLKCPSVFGKSSPGTVNHKMFGVCSIPGMTVSFPVALSAVSVSW
jgi:hypothetical protein